MFDLFEILFVKGVCFFIVGSFLNAYDSSSWWPIFVLFNLLRFIGWDFSDRYTCINIEYYKTFVSCLRVGGTCTYEIHENWAIANSNDSREFPILEKYFL